MADWQVLRETYKSEITTRDWLGGVFFGVMFAWSVTGFIREPEILRGGLAALWFAGVVVEARRFRARLRSMREQDRSGWTR